MKPISWNEGKNERLRAERDVGFEEVLAAIDEGGILDILEHSNKERYAHQKILVVEIDHYAYLIPFVENEKEVFFKTIIPSRKATAHYLIKKK